MLAESKKTLSKNEKIGKCIHFIPACVFPRKIRTFKGFLIFFRDTKQGFLFSVESELFVPLGSLGKHLSLNYGFQTNLGAKQTRIDVFQNAGNRL